MPNTFRFCRVLLMAVVLSNFAAAPLFAQVELSYDSQQGGVHIVQKSDVGGEVKSQFLVTAKGADEVARVHGSVAGVLFQATAQPDNSLKSLPIRLSYDLKGEHDAMLRVTIGNNQLTTDVPAWIWAVAAKFADHEATGAITMTDHPETPAEKRFERRWRSNNTGRLVWVRYHPVVDDTLVGFFLVIADAIAGDAENIRTITDGLKDFEQYGGYSLTLDRAKSKQAARSLDGLISLEAKPGDCAMLNDVDERFVFSAAANGKLQINGSVHYHFARKTANGEFRELDKLTQICRQNHHLFLKTNPAVYKIVDDFAKHVAFFNYIDETDPERLDAFVKDLDPLLESIPTIKTPIALPLSSR